MEPQTVRLAPDLAPDPPPTLEQLLESVPDWYDEARCAAADPDVFFPERGYSADEALAICATCPVVGECLDYALETESDEAGTVGVWGATTARQRSRLRRTARRPEAA